MPTWRQTSFQLPGPYMSTASSNNNSSSACNACKQVSAPDLRAYNLPVLVSQRASRLLALDAVELCMVPCRQQAAEAVCRKTNEQDTNGKCTLHTCMWRSSLVRAANYHQASAHGSIALKTRAPVRVA